MTDDNLLEGSLPEKQLSSDSTLIKDSSSDSTDSADYPSIDSIPDIESNPQSPPSQSSVPSRRQSKSKDSQQILEITEELLKRIESVLFAAGKKVPLEDISKLCNKRGENELILAGLIKLKERYNSSDSSLMVVQDGDAWKLTVREQFMPFVRKIVTQTELKKSVMETLAVIAYKSPMLQCDLIKIRTNKAYDHLALLEEEGYIARKKKGRTKEIALAPKFFEYFDLPESALHDKFKSVQELEQQVEQAEGALEKRKQEIARQKDARKQKEESDKALSAQKAADLDKSIEEHPAIELFDNRGKPHELETYQEPIEPADQPLESEVKIIHNRLGDLEIVATKPKVEIVGDEVVALGEMQVEDLSKKVQERRIKDLTKSNKDDSDVDKRVAEILGGFGEKEPGEQKEEAESSEGAQSDSVQKESVSEESSSEESSSEDSSHEDSSSENPPSQEPSEEEKQ